MQRDLHGGILGGIGDDGNASNASINYCHNVGVVSDTAGRKGGILGWKWNSSTYSLSYNYYLSGKGASYGIGSTSSDNANMTKSLNATQMKTQSNFTNWNFTTIWQMNSTKGYPVLRNQ